MYKHLCSAIEIVIHYLFTSTSRCFDQSTLCFDDLYHCITGQLFLHSSTT